MLPPTHSATHPEALPLWLAMAGFGAYHGLNPAMGWLFALALGLQRKSQRAIWVSLLPITAGHAASVALVAGVLLAVGRAVSLTALSRLTAAVLLGFGVYKLLTYYRHPKWVGMRVGMRDLFVWSFLMAAAHGAGLMVAPTLVGVAGATRQAGLGVAFAVSLHTLSMLAVMAAVAWVVYRKLGLAVLKRGWINFDLIWAVALLTVGGITLFRSLSM